MTVATLEPEATDLALRALAEPRRRAILRLVAHQEMRAGEIAASFDVTRSAVSQHLTVLKQAGLVSERRAGTSRHYRLRRHALQEVQSSLEAIWATALERAKFLAEEQC